MNTDLYCLVSRFLAFFDAATDLKGENNCDNFCITWKRLNVATATKHNGFQWFWRFECFIVRQKRFRKGSNIELESRLEWLVAFRQIFVWFASGFWEPKSNTNQWKTKLESNAKKKQPEQPSKRQWEVLMPRETLGWSPGEGERVNPSPKGLGKITYR